MNTTNSQISSLYRTARNNAALASGSLLSAVPPGKERICFSNAHRPPKLCALYFLNRANS